MKKGRKWLAIAISLLLAICCCVGTLTVFAEDTWDSNLPDDIKELFNAANTFDIEEGENKEEGEKKEKDAFSFDMTTRNDKQVSDSTQITVLTHSLGGNAADWSRDLKAGKDDPAFYYDKDSLIEQLHRNGNANVYWAKMKSKTDFDLIDINAQPHDSYYKNEEEYRVDKIKDTTKHIVLVFEANGARETNATTYFQFNCMLSKVVRDVALCN